jgi:hypothetical protein
MFCGAFPGRYSFGVYAYCFMPDHLHLIVTGESESSELPGMVQAFKSLAAGVVRKIGVFDLWQKGYYDHVLRTGESMDSAAWYVFMNPVRAGLVGRVGEWGFSGSFVFELGRSWHLRNRLCRIGSGRDTAPSEGDGGKKKMASGKRRWRVKLAATKAGTE